MSFPENTLPNSKERAGQSTGHMYCIPLALKDEAERIGCSTIIKEVNVTTTIDGEEITVPAALMSDDGHRFTEMTACRMNDLEIPLALPKSGEATFSHLPSNLPPDESQELCASLLVEGFLDFLAKVGAALGGFRFMLHYVGTGFHEPLSDEADVIHVFLHATPSKSLEYSFPHTLFGIDVCTPNGYYSSCAPFPFRGCIAGDGKHDLVQIVGNNFYILFDALMLCHAGAEKAAAIFRKAIASAVRTWNLGRVEVADGATEGSPASDDELRAILASSIRVPEKKVREEIERMAKEVAQMESKLRAARRLLADTRMALAGLTEQYRLGHSLIEQFVADHRRIAEHPLVAEVRFEQHRGFLVRTKAVTIAHEGATYRIGSFNILLDMTRKARVWPETSFHPEHVPHPHISSYGNPCYGNIGDAIDAALAEFRFGDAADYLLLWLAEGYTPELISIAEGGHKIEEWPVAEISPDERSLHG